METQTLEGTWEEILQHSAELAGQRVRLTILPHESPNTSMIPTLEEKLKGRVGRVNFQPCQPLSLLLVLVLQKRCIY